MSFAAPARAWLRRPLRLAAALGLAGVVVAAVVVALAVQALAVPPRILGPYLERRSSGHNALIEATGRAAARWLAWIDRGSVTPRLAWPDWLPPASAAPAPPPGREVLVLDAAQLRAALASALPGDVITMAPGSYRFSGSSLAVTRPGTPSAPITVRAPGPGLARLQFDLVEGFHVLASHWVFENLAIEGVCRQHDDCEHAFHVVGAAHHTVIRHNEIRNFNAHVKINGAQGRFPDDGRLVANRLLNDTARRTGNPVTPIDLVAASGWLVQHNLIADFVKDGGDRTSYGAFAKGAGAGNRFIANVVLCEHRLRGAPGRRIGLSYGGGGSGAASCRDARCDLEHRGGEMRDNLIASCADAGIYLNRAVDPVLVHNTVLDTAGVQARASTGARLQANLLDGGIRVDAASSIAASDSSASWLAPYLGWHPVRREFRDAATLDLRWSGSPPRGAAADAPQHDLCGPLPAPRQVRGAFEDIAGCAQRAAGS